MQTTGRMWWFGWYGGYEKSRPRSYIVPFAGGSLWYSALPFRSTVPCAALSLPPYQFDFYLGWPSSFPSSGRAAASECIEMHTVDSVRRCWHGFATKLNTSTRLVVPAGWAGERERSIFVLTTFCSLTLNWMPLHFWQFLFSLCTIVYSGLLKWAGKLNFFNAFAHVKCMLGERKQHFENRQRRVPLVANQLLYWWHSRSSSMCGLVGSSPGNLNGKLL